jgi:hypothetical protein
LARHVDKAYGVAYFTGIAKAATSEANFLETLSRSPAWRPTGDVSAVPYELAAARWDAPDPATVALDLTVEGRRLATVSSRMGGFPWSAEAFGRRLGALPRATVADVIAGAGR